MVNGAPARSSAISFTIDVCGFDGFQKHRRVVNAYGRFYYDQNSMNLDFIAQSSNFYLSSPEHGSDAFHIMVNDAAMKRAFLNIFFMQIYFFRNKSFQLLKKRFSGVPNVLKLERYKFIVSPQ